MPSFSARVVIPTIARGRRRVVAVAVAGLAAAAVPVAASATMPTGTPTATTLTTTRPTATPPRPTTLTAAPAAVAARAAGPAVTPAAAPTPLPQLLLTPRDLNGLRGSNNWGVSSQRLTPATTVERLAGCSGKSTLSPSVARTLQIKDGTGWEPEGPSVDQKVVRYQRGRAAAVIDIFRDTVARCPVRTFSSGTKERWRVISDTGTTRTDRLIIRREPRAPATPYRSHIVVSRVQDKVSLISYDAGHSLTGDPKGARTLASRSANRLGN